MATNRAKTKNTTEINNDNSDNNNNNDNNNNHNINNITTIITITTTKSLIVQNMCEETHTQNTKKHNDRQMPL
jgi:hypothetical protein